MKKGLTVLLVILILLGQVGCSSPYFVPNNQIQPKSTQKVQEPEFVAFKFYEAQRTGKYSVAWDCMSPAYRTFWKSFEQYVDFMANSKTLIPEYDSILLNDKFAEKRQDGPEHIMLWYPTTNKNYYFFNLIKINSEWKVYNTGGVLHPGDLPK
ncbi:hypothetical protein [Desulfosporosinus sp. FKA]|uniref:hypothetical protein n=1 Tax=Desulfosporosinus sp. FKA TaxID=1969834 RepID=UPI000B49D91D|nr:hypothetical protein [Desulfosporosinus sp. FKA]